LWNSGGLIYYVWCHFEMWVRTRAEGMDTRDAAPASETAEEDTAVTTMTKQLQAKSFDVPDEATSVGSRARIESIRLGDITAHRVSFQPGFRWTEHVKPSVGTDLCEVPHTG
jgi:hypothetical protein